MTIDLSKLAPEELDVLFDILKTEAELMTRFLNCTTPQAAELIEKWQLRLAVCEKVGRRIKEFKNANS